MKKIFAVALLITIQFSFGETLKQLVDKEISPFKLSEVMTKSLEEYKTDSLNKLIFHAPDFMNDYAFEEQFFNYLGKKKLSH